MEKEWLVRRVGTPDSVGGVYAERDNGELYYLSPNHNGNEPPLIGMQMPERSERGA